ncbi:hypothetical protein MRX96_005305 [Rhipicephalus microplus]
MTGALRMVAFAATVALLQSIRLRSSRRDSACWPQNTYAGLLKGAGYSLELCFTLVTLAAVCTLRCQAACSVTFRLSCGDGRRGGTRERALGKWPRRAATVRSQRAGGAALSTLIRLAVRLEGLPAARSLRTRR